MSIRSTSLEPKSQLTINLALKRKQKKEKKRKGEKEKIPDQKNRKKAKRLQLPRKLQKTQLHIYVAPHGRP